MLLIKSLVNQSVCYFSNSISREHKRNTQDQITKSLALQWGLYKCLLSQSYLSTVLHASKNNYAVSFSSFRAGFLEKGLCFFSVTTINRR